MPIDLPQAPPRSLVAVTPPAVTPVAPAAAPATAAMPATAADAFNATSADSRVLLTTPAGAVTPLPSLALGDPAPSGAGRVRAFLTGAVLSEPVLLQAEVIARGADGAIDAGELAAIVEAWNAALASGATPSTQARLTFARITGLASGIDATRPAPSTLSDSTVESAINQLLMKGWEHAHVERRPNGDVAFKLDREGTLWGAWTTGSWRYYEHGARLEGVIKQDGTVEVTQQWQRGGATSSTSTLDRLIHGEQPKAATVSDLLPAGEYRISANRWDTFEALTGVRTEGSASFNLGVLLRADGSYGLTDNGGVSDGLRVLEVKRNEQTGRLDVRVATDHYVFAGSCPFELTSSNGVTGAAGVVLKANVSAGPMPRNARPPDWKLPADQRIGG